MFFYKKFNLWNRAIVISLLKKYDPYKSFQTG